MLLRNKAGFIGFIGIVFFIGVSVFGPLFVPYEGQPQFSRRVPGATTLFQGPSPEFPLGLDWQGRSVLSHIVNGGQTLIITSVIAGLMASLIAVVLGSMAGLLGGIVDQVFSAISNFILTIPQTPLLLVLAGFLQLDNHFLLAVLIRRAELAFPDAGACGRRCSVCANAITSKRRLRSIWGHGTSSPAKSSRI